MAFGTPFAVVAFVAWSLLYNVESWLFVEVQLLSEKILTGIVGLFAESAVCNCFLGQIVRTAGGVTGNAGKGRRDSGFVELASLFLKGKILYTPDNNVTRFIVSQVSGAMQ